MLPALGMLLAFIYCLLFDAFISPTDPVVVLGILTKAGLPKPLETNIVGKSLFNYGVGVVLFATVLSVAATGTETTIPSQVPLLREGVGGLALGAVLGYSVYRILRNVDNYKVEVLLTLVLVTGGSVLAAALHTSGPLAIVMAGLIVGSHQGRHGLSEATEDYLDKFWELIDGVLNVVMFGPDGPGNARIPHQKPIPRRGAGGGAAAGPHGVRQHSTELLTGPARAGAGAGGLKTYPSRTVLPRLSRQDRSAFKQSWATPFGLGFRPRLQWRVRSPHPARAGRA